MKEYNLLKSYPKALRNISERKKNQEENCVIAKKFGFEYFDGTREQGYGGYYYDGRWLPIAKHIVEYYDLKKGDKVLDIGCAKGFLIRDLMQVCPGLEVWGLDISKYALLNGHIDVKNYLICGTAENLPFKDDFFHVILCINVIHNLEKFYCSQAIREIERVSKGNSYIQVDAYRNEAEKSIFEDWVLTAITYGTPDFWLELFKEANYSGDYYWTILEADQKNNG